MRTRKRHLNLKNISTLAFLLSAIAPAPAQFLFTSVSGEYASIIGTNLTSGASFTVGNQPILVTALGVYDDQANGLGQNYQVGIWGSGGLVTSATVPAGTGTTLQGDFRYVSIPPLALSANTTYRLGSNLGFNDTFPLDLIGLEGSFTLDPAFSAANPKDATSNIFTA